MNRQTLTQCGFVIYKRAADAATTSASRRVSLEEEEDNDAFNDDDDDEDDEFQEFTQEFTQQAIHQDDFLEEEEEDVPDTTNDEVVLLNTTPQSKKQKISRQSTLDFPKFVPIADQPFKDTENRWFVSHGFQMYVFNKFETFVIEVNRRTDSHFVEKYLFTITDFAVKRSYKWGLSQRPLVCNLEMTFIGSKETKRLVNDPAWKKLHPKDPGLVECHMTNILPPDGAYRLRQLRPLDKNEPPFYRSTDIPPEPSLVYEAPNPDLGRCQFTMAYRQKHHGKPVEKTTLVPRLLDHKPVALDLFAGAGGMGIGLAKTGFHVKYAVEINPAAAATLQCNHRDTQVFEEDVKMFLEKSKAHDPCYPKPGDVDHIHASSPCQGFSGANRNGGVNDKVNNELSFLFVEAMRLFKPRTGSFENVFGMLSEARGNRPYMQKIMADLLLLGYSVRLSILNAAYYGDPQSRKHVFLFCARNGVPLPAFPTPTHGADKAVMATARDALKSLELVNPVPGSGRVHVKDPLDGSFHVVTNHNLESTEIKAESKPLKADGPANTVLRQNGVEHYLLPRGLTIRERARLQSFPDDYQFSGSLLDRSNQIGNAVPVNVAHAVARTLYESHVNEYEGGERNHINNVLEDDWKDLDDPTMWDWYDNEVKKDLARVV